MFKEYYRLTKPGIIYGNIITTVGGFALGAQGRIDPWLLAATFLGLSLVIASSCVFNNYIDRDIDAAMERTSDRALVKGRVFGRAALIYGTCLGVVGFFLLGFYTNILAMAAAALGVFFYIFMYSMWFKRRSVYGTVVGSIAGATPPVVGYCAASGRFNGGAIILFLILALWQMPHFFAIGIYRLKEYVAASIPILPAKKGILTTKIAMVIYIIAFIVAAAMLTAYGYMGRVYLVVAVVLGLAWLRLCIKGFWNSGAADDVRWARQMFLFSLVVITAVFATISITSIWH